MKSDIGPRIESLLKTQNLNQAQAAKLCGVRSASISQWKSGTHTPTAENLQRLATVLKTTPDYILRGEKDEHVKEGHGRYRSDLTSLPLVTLHQAKIWKSTKNDMVPGDYKRFYITSASVHDGSFALIMPDDTMTNPAGFPSAPEGSIIVFDTTEAASNGKIIIANTANEGLPTIKKLLIDGPYWYLKPLNPDYKPVQVDHDIEIIGVAKKIEMDV